MAVFFSHMQRSDRELLSSLLLECSWFSISCVELKCTVT